MMLRCGCAWSLQQECIVGGSAEHRAVLGLLTQKRWTGNGGGGMMEETWESTEAWKSPCEGEELAAGHRENAGTKEVALERFS